MTSPIGFIGDSIDAFTGQAGAEASLEGARQQALLGREGLASIRERQQRLEQTLAPFVGEGRSRISQAEQLFGPGAAQQITQDPAFQAAADRLKLQALTSQAARGRLPTQETAEQIQGGLTRLGSDFLTRQRGDLLRQIQLGQASAAQQGASSLGTSQRAGDILSQIGAVTGAGGIGAAQSLAQGQSNVAGLAGTVAGFFSDRRLKRNISLVGSWKGYNKYKYQYKDHDTWYYGVMSDEVRDKNPEAITVIGGYDCVDYGAL